jgi:hypothetical protein
MLIIGEFRRAIAIVFSCCDYSYFAEWGINYFGLFQPAKNSAKAKSRNITITIIATIIFDVFYSFYYFVLN